MSFKVIGDVELLSQLNEGSFGATQVGKFATIYPSSDAAARRLAAALVNLTRGYHGPIVATDLKLGDVVYARYGAFTPVVVRDRLGRHASYVRGSDRRLLRDDYTVPFAMPRGRANPFAGVAEEEPRAPARAVGLRSPLFGPGFRLLDVLKADPKGNVYRGLDLHDQQHVAIWVIKEGRRWCLADAYGRDMRSRLRHQADVHQALGGRVPVPDVGDYFEVDGHGYLPIAYESGRTIVQMAGDDRRARPWSALGIGRQRELLQGLLGAVDAVMQLHRAGYVHRDLSGGNVLMRRDGTVVLLDLELAHEIDDKTPPFGLGTPGFMSPDQEARKPPAPADDVYAIGALALLLLMGIDPRRLTFAAPLDRLGQWASLAAGVDRRLLELAVRCVDARAPRRPKLAEIRGALASALVDLGGARGSASVLRPAVGPGDARRRVREGMRGLLRQTLTDRESGLWLSDAFDMHETGAERRRRHELRRSANRGVAGVLYVLGRLARCGYRTPAGDEQASRAARWLLRGPVAPDTGLPGLHFGEAGVAVALVEASAGGLIAHTPGMERFLRQALAGTLDWPDLTHGAAGQGIAALYCADRLADPSLAALSGRCARYLIDTQYRAGHWTWPSAPRGSRDVYTGFAHGVAGITYFLAEYARAYRRRRRGTLLEARRRLADGAGRAHGPGVDLAQQHRAARTLGVVVPRLDWHRRAVPAALRADS